MTYFLLIFLRSRNFLCKNEWFSCTGSSQCSCTIEQRGHIRTASNWVATIYSVHKHPEFLGAHPYPHCVLIFQVFLSTLAPTLPPKKPISGYKTFMNFGFLKRNNRKIQKILQKWMIFSVSESGSAPEI